MSQIAASECFHYASREHVEEIMIEGLFDGSYATLDGHVLPRIIQVGRKYNMPGGGSEMQFPYPVKPEYMTVIDR